MPSRTNPSCKVTVGAGAVASKVFTIGKHYLTNNYFKEYNSHARTELLSDIDNINSNLPDQNYLIAVKLIKEAVEENLQVSDLINLIHNQALQDLPNVRQRFFIRLVDRAKYTGAKYHVRFDYGDNFLEVGVNKYSNGNIQGFQSVGRRKHNGVK